MISHLYGEVKHGKQLETSQDDEMKMLYFEIIKPGSYFALSRLFGERNFDSIKKSEANAANALTIGRFQISPYRAIFADEILNIAQLELKV